MAMFVLLGFILRRAAQKGIRKGINPQKQAEALRRIERRALISAGAGAAIGFYGAVIGSRGLFAAGFSFAIVQASLPLLSRMARR
jgi:hypothetical protein